MMSEDKIEIQPIQDALYVIGGKWKFPILYSLCKGEKRFTDVQNDVMGISPKMLTKELRELEINKLIKRTVHDSYPVLIEYSITEYGQTLEPVLRKLQEWGKTHREKIREQ